VVVDRLTKAVEFVPYRKKTSAVVFGHLFLREVAKRHGLPKVIVSDRGQPFISHFMEAVYRAQGVERAFSTTFHPQTDGQTERVNATLEQYLRAYCNYQQDNWVSLLPLAQFVCNNSVSASTGITPFWANLGRHPR